MNKRSFGLANIKTAVRCQMRSKPRPSDTEHVNLFLLEKNRNRIQRETERLQVQLERLNKELVEVGKQIAKITRGARDRPASAGETNKGKEAKRELRRPMKKMELHY